MSSLPSRRQLIREAKDNHVKYYCNKSKEELCNALGYTEVIAYNNPKLNNKLNRLKPIAVRFVNINTGDEVFYKSLYEANKITKFPVKMLLLLRQFDNFQMKLKTKKIGVKKL